ncbi:hypothetical protein LC087_13155 [Bacillus carboniphilus]|uniref:Uncharacterized protein n=1 Tax=Bacillus carboniphilus TaxID=86663 RepID=A0ABY9JTN1_9BACI|nr:hypothetical protein [Bacillus carboniphilus]WLR41790.1 hypothetical protein LC087_13155 [Bacillus carboniphilus]
MNVKTGHFLFVFVLIGFISLNINQLQEGDFNKLSIFSLLEN